MKLSRFKRIRILLFIFALLPILAGGALSVHSTLLANGTKGLLAKINSRTDTEHTGAASAKPEGAADSKEFTDPEDLVSILELYSTIGLVISLASFCLLVSILITLHRGRLGLYRNLLRKLAVSGRDKTIFTLDNLIFPNEDDLGNLGETLNAIIARLREFETLRQEELLLADALTRAVIHEREEPLAVFDDRLVLLFFSPSFAAAMKAKVTGGVRAGMHTKDIFKDLTGLEQLVMALGKEGETEFELRQSADALVPVRALTITRPEARPGQNGKESNSKRLVMRFAERTGSYS